MTNIGVVSLERAEMRDFWLKHREMAEFDECWGFHASAEKNYRIALTFWRLYKEADYDIKSVDKIS